MAVQHATVSIGAGASLSGAAKIAGRLVGIYLPAWDSAAVTFQACDTSDGTFQNVYDDAGNEESIAASTGDRYVHLNPDDWLGVNFVKCRSGTAAAAVNQTTAETLTLVFQTGT